MCIITKLLWHYKRNAGFGEDGLGGQGTPLIVIGKQKIQGFQPDKIAQMLIDEAPKKPAQ
jgi:hypothetical protein